jgi:hypothetical protein
MDRRGAGSLALADASSGKVLDDPAFSTSSGAVIPQYQLNGGLNQRWNFVGLPNGKVGLARGWGTSSRPN